MRYSLLGGERARDMDTIEIQMGDKRASMMGTCGKKPSWCLLRFIELCCVLI